MKLFKSLHMKMAATVASVFLIGASNAVAGMSVDLTDLNARIGKQMSQFNDSSSLAQMFVSSIELEPARAGGLVVSQCSATGLITKKSVHNALEFKIEDLKYTFDPFDPQIDAHLTLKLDMQTALGNARINAHADTVAESALAFVSLYLLPEDYGQAVTTYTHVDRKVVDAAGDVQEIDFEVEIKVDLNKLPFYVRSQDVAFTAFNAKVKVDRNGGSAKLHWDGNPDFVFYNSGFTAYVLQFVIGDFYAWRHAENYVGTLDSILAWLVTLKDGNPR